MGRVVRCGLLQLAVVAEPAERGLPLQTTVGQRGAHILLRDEAVLRRGHAPRSRPGPPSPRVSRPLCGPIRPVRPPARRPPVYQGWHVMEYGFDSPKYREFPPMVYVSIVNICNLNCIHCHYPTFASQPDWKPSMMPWDYWTKLCDEMGEYPWSILNLGTDGEPMVHKKF